MTDKRFTIGDRALQEVYGGCIPAILDGGIPCTQSQVLKLLNELHEENEQLKYKLSEHMVDLNNCTGKCSALEKENEELKFENNELKCALALDEVDYILADGKKIDIPPYYEFKQRYDSVMHRREYDEYD